MKKSPASKPVNKLRFTMVMQMNGGIRSTSSKACNSFVTLAECEHFVDQAKARLDDLLNNWKELYNKES